MKDKSWEKRVLKYSPTPTFIMVYHLILIFYNNYQRGKRNSKSHFSNLYVVAVKIKCQVVWALDNPPYIFLKNKPLKKQSAEKVLFLQSQKRLKSTLK